MKFELYQIDAFTDTVFGGNPACVLPLENWLPDDLMLNIAKENCVAETAFMIPGDNKIPLRWFTPEIEMDLCGHATLAAAHCLITFLNYKKGLMIFSTISGDLHVTEKNGLYSLDLPSRVPAPAKLPDSIMDSLSIKPQDVLKSRDYILVYKSEADIRNIRINKNLFDQVNLDPGGVAITAKGEQSDFVSRFFTPQSSIFEDPITGSAHCSLIPYWSKRLGKSQMTAIQLSERLGHLTCMNNGNRDIISGQAITYSSGSIWI